MLLMNLAEKFQHHEVQYCVVGGLAVVFHGVTRGTMDIDIIVHITLKNLTKAETALNELGLVSRLPIRAKELAAFKTEYIEKRNLIEWSFVNPKNPSEIVDIIITHDSKNIKKDFINLYGKKIPVISKPDLIKMKLESGRPQDLEDVKALRGLDEK